MTTTIQKLTPLPDGAAVRALSRSQLEQAVMDGAVLRCKLEQRVMELEAASVTTKQPPQAVSDDRRDGRNNGKR